MNTKTGDVLFRFAFLLLFILDLKNKMGATLPRSPYISGQLRNFMIFRAMKKRKYNRILYK